LKWFEIDTDKVRRDNFFNIWFKRNWFRSLKTLMLSTEKTVENILKFLYFFVKYDSDMYNDNNRQLFKKYTII